MAMDLADLDLDNFLVSGDPDPEDAGCTRNLEKVSSALTTPLVRGRPTENLCLLVDKPEVTKREGEGDRSHLRSFNLYPVKLSIKSSDTFLQQLPPLIVHHRFKHIQMLHDKLAAVHQVKVPEKLPSKEGLAANISRMFGSVSRDLSADLEAYLKGLLASELACRTLLLKAFFCNFQILKIVLGCKSEGDACNALTGFGEVGQKLWREHCVLPDFTDWARTRLLLPSLPSLIWQLSWGLTLQPIQSLSDLWGEIRSMFTDVGLSCTSTSLAQRKNDVPGRLLEASDSHERLPIFTQVKDGLAVRAARRAQIESMIELREVQLTHALHIAEERLKKQRDIQTLLLIPHGFDTDEDRSELENAISATLVDSDAIKADVQESLTQMICLQKLSSAVSDDRKQLCNALVRLANLVPGCLEIVRSLAANSLQNNNATTNDLLRLLRKAVDSTITQTQTCANATGADIVRLRQETRLIDVLLHALAQEQREGSVSVDNQGDLDGLANSRQRALQEETELRKQKIDGLQKHLDCLQNAQRERASAADKRCHDRSATLHKLREELQNQSDREGVAQIRREALVARVPGQKERRRLEERRLNAQLGAHHLLLFAGTTSYEEDGFGIVLDRHTGRDQDESNAAEEFSIFQSDRQKLDDFRSALECFLRRFQDLKSEVSDANASIADAKLRTCWELNGGEEYSDPMDSELEAARAVRRSIDSCIESEVSKHAEEENHMAEESAWVSEQLASLEELFEGYDVESKSWDDEFICLAGEKKATNAELLPAMKKAQALYAPLVQAYEGTTALTTVTDSTLKNSAGRLSKYRQVEQQGQALEECFKRTAHDSIFRQGQLKSALEEAEKELRAQVASTAVGPPVRDCSALHQLFEDSEAAHRANQAELEALSSSCKVALEELCQDRGELAKIVEILASAEDPFEFAEQARFGRGGAHGRESLISSVSEVWDPEMDSPELDGRETQEAIAFWDRLSASAARAGRERSAAQQRYQDLVRDAGNLDQEELARAAVSKLCEKVQSASRGPQAELAKEVRVVEELLSKLAEHASMRKQRIEAFATGVAKRRRWLQEQCQHLETKYAGGERKFRERLEQHQAQRQQQLETVAQLQASTRAEISAWDCATQSVNGEKRQWKVNGCTVRKLRADPATWPLVYNKQQIDLPFGFHETQARITALLEIAADCHAALEVLKARGGDFLKRKEHVMNDSAAFGRHQHELQDWMRDFANNSQSLLVADNGGQMPAFCSDDAPLWSVKSSWDALEGDIVRSSNLASSLLSSSQCLQSELSSAADTEQHVHATVEQTCAKIAKKDAESHALASNCYKGLEAMLNVAQRRRHQILQDQRAALQESGALPQLEQHLSREALEAVLISLPLGALDADAAEEIWSHCSFRKDDFQDLLCSLRAPIDAECIGELWSHCNYDRRSLKELFENLHVGLDIATLQAIWSHCDYNRNNFKEILASLQAAIDADAVEEVWSHCGYNRKDFKDILANLGGSLDADAIKRIWESCNYNKQKFINQVKNASPGINKVWSPHASCDGSSAKSRAQWLIEQQGMSILAARQTVMNEFPQKFSRVPGWNPAVDCDGSTAEERSTWLQNHKKIPAHEARKQVMTEFPKQFSGGSVWNPAVSCDGKSAGQRATWLEENFSMVPEVARHHVMQEFPDLFAC